MSRAAFVGFGVCNLSALPQFSKSVIQSEAMNPRATVLSTESGESERGGIHDDEVGIRMGSICLAVAPGRSRPAVEVLRIPRFALDRLGSIAALWMTDMGNVGRGRVQGNRFGRRC